ncbi:hypothetical protein GGQ88_002546 [Novosphingobium hassiacum]|uniref:Uncharacterized protein n=1 Tax=Novosphingobium hassiacum TaxID=173676 RepID=A0A7W6EWW8_9SPHN|nr:hypothetical protein [Novosphingobium hassiacum]MBB3861274.1 hypothetical protein [Novosphingobium hassiacum]
MRGILRQAQDERVWGAALLLCVAACAPAKLAEGRVKSALVDAGISDANAACMAERMTDRLSIGQLKRLQSLQGAKRGIGDYLATVRRLGDAELLGVTTSAAALCATGFAPEKKS